MKTMKSTSFNSGLSGLQLNIPRYLYPPLYENPSRLIFYASLFNSIEINSSFYKIPQKATVEKWAASVPGNFKFTFKLWQEITHSKGFDFNTEDVATFLDVITSVENKRGCLLIQLPPSLGIESISQLDQLLSCIREIENDHWNLAIEFRNKSWYVESAYNLLKAFKAALVIHDIPKSSTPFVIHESDFLYFRFHGPIGNYRDTYSEVYLEEYAAHIKERIEKGKQVYAYFNNTMGDAFNNLKTLNSFLDYKLGPV